MKSIITKTTKRFAIVVLFGGALLTIGAGAAFAQVHDQTLERDRLKQHQRIERQQYGNRDVRDHQRAEDGQFKYKERQERRGSYRGQYGYPPYGSGRYPYPPYGSAYPNHQSYPAGYGSWGAMHGNNYPAMPHCGGWGDIFRRH